MRISSETSVKIDNFLDYIPVVSTVNELVDLYKKHVTIPNMERNIAGKAQVNKDAYYSHLKDKSDTRCILLLIPVLGNILIAMDDFFNREMTHKDSALGIIRKYGGINMRNASLSLRRDPQFVEEAVTISGWAFEHVHEDLKKDKNIALLAAKQNPVALLSADESLWDNDDFVVQALQITKEYYSQPRKEKVSFPFYKASQRIRSNKEIAAQVLDVYPRAFRELLNPLPLINDKEFILERARKDPDIIEDLWVCQSPLIDDNDIVMAVVAQKPDNIRYASERLQGLDNPR